MTASLLSLRLLAALSFIFLLLGCQNITGNDNSSSEAEEQPFFDMRDYFTRQIDRLQQLQPRAQKTVTFQEQTETKTFDTLNYERELEVFLNTDINRVAWWDRYRIDSSFTDQGQLRAVAYTAMDEDLRIRELTVTYENEAVSRIEVQSETSGPAADRQQQLFFDPSWGYRIESLQDVAFSKAREMKIEVRFD